MADRLSTQELPRTDEDRPVRGLRWAIIVVVVIVAFAVVAGNRWFDGDGSPDQLRRSDECYGKPVSCVMTEDVGIFGVPLPREELQFASLHEPYPNRADLWATNTRYATWQEFASFYEAYMNAQGWAAVEGETVDVDASDGTQGRRMVWSRSGAKLGIFVLWISTDDDPYTSIWLNNQY